jgi:aspartate/methionine/tyrosine aminotransferase
MIEARSDMDSMQMTRRLIQDFGVAVIPGSAFGMRQGCHLRVSYGALQQESAMEGIQRLVRGLRALTGGSGQ